MTANKRVGRFSDGQETVDATSQHTRIGRFSDGQALGQPQQAVAGRFSTGQELLAETVEHTRVGRFGDVEAVRPAITLEREAEATGQYEVERVTS